MYQFCNSPCNHSRGGPCMSATPESSPPRRPSFFRDLVPLAFVALGVAFYLTPNLLRLSPELPLMPLIMAYAFGPALCALLVLGWWLVMGSARFTVRLLVFGLAVILGAAAWFAADP